MRPIALTLLLVLAPVWNTAAAPCSTSSATAHTIEEERDGSATTVTSHRETWNREECESADVQFTAAGQTAQAGRTYGSGTTTKESETARTSTTCPEEGPCRESGNSSRGLEDRRGGAAGTGVAPPLGPAVLVLTCRWTVTGWSASEETWEKGAREDRTFSYASGDTSTSACRTASFDGTQADLPAGYACEGTDRFVAQGTRTSWAEGESFRHQTQASGSQDQRFDCWVGANSAEQSVGGSVLPAVWAGQRTSQTRGVTWEYNGFHAHTCTGGECSHQSGYFLGRNTSGAWNEANGAGAAGHGAQAERTCAERSRDAWTESRGETDWFLRNDYRSSRACASTLSAATPVGPAGHDVTRCERQDHWASRVSAEDYAWTTEERASCSAGTRQEAAVDGTGTGADGAGATLEAGDREEFHRACSDTDPGCATQDGHTLHGAARAATADGATAGGDAAVPVDASAAYHPLLPQTQGGSRGALLCTGMC